MGNKLYFSSLLCHIALLYNVILFPIEFAFTLAVMARAVAGFASKATTSQPKDVDKSDGYPMLAPTSRTEHEPLGDTICLMMFIMTAWKNEYSCSLSIDK